MPPAGGVASVRVVVRVRPSIRQEARLADTEPSLLSIDEGYKCISVGKTSEQRVPKQFRFDGVFGPSVSQEQLYKQAAIDDLVKAAALGFHATVFAYGQTGSGKTFTMEGFNYVSCGVPPPGSIPQAGNQSFSIKAQPPPFADFKGTPPEQLGVVPRVAEALFKELQQASTGRRATVRCSFVQLYKEQAYDLLNPSPAPTTPGLTQGLQTKAGGLSGLGNALRMRWNKADDFYLENLFKVECASSEEVLAAFKRGVSNKAMAAHRMNDASSRSHCLYTLYIDSAPVASPSEVISSRLTLVDLAGSERSAQTGATDGTLRDESLAINKSLFTLRQVVLALSANSSQQQQQQQQQHVPCSPNKASTAAPPASGLGGSPLGTVSAAHVPYRDSKLTALLKNSLGGNTLTTMIACISPMNAALEENISTLEYAARAKRVTNQVTINEDPKTRVIRELRAEVAFLRSQLAALHGPDAAALAMPPTGTLTSHPPSPLALPAGSPRLPGLSVPAGDGPPMSPNKAGLPPRPPLPPSQPRALQIKGDASQASSSPSSPSRVPGAHASPSPLAPAASPLALSRSGSAEALGSTGGPHTPSARGLPRSGSLDAVDGPPRTSSMSDGGVQVASSQPQQQQQQQQQQRGAVAALTDLASLEQVGSGPALPEGESFTSVKAQLLRATHMDVGVLAHKLLDAVGLVQQVSNANQQLRKAYDASATAGDGVRAENEELMMENVQLRDRLSLLEGLAGIVDAPSQPRTSNSKALSHQNSANSAHKSSTPVAAPAAAGMGVSETGASTGSCNGMGATKHGGPSGQTQGLPGGMTSGAGNTSNGGAAPAPAPSLLTASSSALIELQELRKENTLLHTRLHKAEAVAHAYMHNANAGGPNMQLHHSYPHPHSLLNSHGGPGTPTSLPPPAPFRRSPASRATLSQSLPSVSLPNTAEGSSPQPPSTGHPSPPTSVFAAASSGSHARLTPPRQPSFLGSNSSGSSSSSAGGGIGGNAITRSVSSWGQGQGQGQAARLVAGSPKTGPFAGATGGVPSALSATVSAPLPSYSPQQKHHPNPQQQQQQQQQQQSGSVGSGSLGCGSQHSDPPSPTLSQITQQMSTRSLTSGLRVSTTGQLLASPAALNTSITSSGGAASLGINGMAAPGSSVGTPVGASRQVLPGMQHASGVSGVGVATPPSVPLSMQPSMPPCMPPSCGPGGGGSQQHCSSQSASFSVPGHGTLGAGVLSGRLGEVGGMGAGGVQGHGQGQGHHPQHNRLAQLQDLLEGDSKGEKGDAEGGSEVSVGERGGMGDSAAQLVQLFQARSAMARMRMV